MNMSMKWLGAAVFAVIVAAVVIFAVLPTLPDVPSASDLSLKAVTASACCGDGGAGGPGGNNDEDPEPEPEPDPTVCAITPEEQTIELGESASFSWTTENASRVTLDGDNVGGDGEDTVTPDAVGTYTYTIKAFKGKLGLSLADTCVTKVIVEEPEEPEVEAPICTLNIDKTEIDQGESVELTWTSENGVSATLEGDSVSLNGSDTDSPSTDTTYTLIVTGEENQTVTCEQSVTVNEVPGAPICELFVDPNQVTEGDNARVEWDSTNVTQILIEEVITGSATTTFQDTTAGTGSVVITPTATTTYFGTFTGPGGVVTCEDEVTIIPEEEEPLLCTLDADPTSFGSSGGDTTLTWTSDNADSVSIDQGIGSVNLNGTTTAAVTNDTLFTLTATRGDETKQCTVNVNVDDGGGGGDNPRCDAFSVSPTELGNNGGEVELTWETTDGEEVHIDNGIGIVDADGATTTNVTNDTTFTLTVENDGETDECTVSVNVDDGGGGGGSPSPRCDLFEATPSNYGPGDTIILRWETDNGRDLRIEPDLFETSDDDLIEEGSRVVTLGDETRLTLIVERGSRDDECVLEPDNGGGGGGGPDVQVLSERDQRVITLTDIPYTGFDAGPTLTALFYTLLTFWSLAVAYVVVIQRGSVLGFALPAARMREMQGSAIPQYEYTAYTQPTAEAKTEQINESVAAPTAAAPANLPTWSSQTTAYAEEGDTDEAKEVVEETDAHLAEDEDAHTETVTTLENHAHLQNVLLSSEALRLVADEAETDAERIGVLDGVIERAKADFPREDGWIVINRERANMLLPGESTTDAVAEQENSLATAIVAGDAAGAYAALGEYPMNVLAEAADTLDRVYRVRHNDSVSVSESLIRDAADISNDNLVAAITALTTAIDGTYADQDAAVKIAVIKAIKAVT